MRNFAVMIQSAFSFKAASGGLYVHIPFCRRKCLYCDFFSGGASVADWKSFRRALLAEFRARKAELPKRIATIYIGGGTPSLMPLDEFTALCDGIARIAADALPDGLSGVEEFTLEVNPEDVSFGSASAWRNLGVNRISMGVQSLVDCELKAVGRSHSAELALTSAAILREVFDNLSLDIMFGLPGQTLESLDYTLNGMLSLAPDHISAYSLMYEEGTALTAMAGQGRITPLADETCLEMYSRISSRLAREGFGHYEISNYARDGYRAMHNSSYWDFAPYLGLGPSAHSYDGHSIRRSNPSRIREYIARFAPSDGNISSDLTPFYIEERLSQKERLEEYVMLRLRVREGIDLDEFSERFGLSATRNLQRGVDSILSSSPGVLSICDNRIALSEEAVMRADDVILRLALALDD